jgi:hypothetical protein
MDFVGEVGMLTGFIEDFFGSFTEGVVDVVVEFTQLNTVLVDQAVEVSPLLALVSAIWSVRFLRYRLP